MPNKKKITIKSYVMIVFMALLITGLLGCAKTHGSNESGTSIKKFSSYQEFLDYVKNSGSESNNYYRTNYRTTIQSGAKFTMDSAESAPSAMMATDSSGSNTYSTTNVQVGGVDEADFVKNDEKYIYMINGEELLIIDAYPNAEIISKTPITGQPVGLFVNGDELEVISQDYDDSEFWPLYSLIPSHRTVPKTRVFIYDISDRKNPKLQTNYSASGIYDQARMTNGVLYLITTNNLYEWQGWGDYPVIEKDGSVIKRSDIYYFDNPQDSYRLALITAIKDGDIDAKSFLIGYSDTIYMSKKNIYLAYTKNYLHDYREDQKERFYKTVVPQLPSEVKDRIMDAGDDWLRVADILDKYYERLSKEEKDELAKRVMEAATEYDTKIAYQRSKTIIQKIRVDGTSISIEGSAEVRGRPLNQFSMDEYNNKLRVATTISVWIHGTSVQENNVYVLDNNMMMVGKLEGVAPDERIKSTRFIGDKLFMVTFESIDPFFVIDLSNDQPKIIGELKLPGWSDYLHPYDKNHIIGIGRDTQGDEWGGLRVKGIKVALFDISDLKNPKLTNQIVIGDTGSFSEVLRDHKAFLLDKRRGYMVVPVTIVQKYDDWGGHSSDKMVQAAAVIGINDSGLTKKGLIKHDQDIRRWWYSGAVRRALYIGDVLYTISDYKIMMNDVDTLNDIGSIKLEHDKPPSMPYPVVLDH